MLNKFQLFGSKSSLDYDIMVFVEQIPNIEFSKKLCYYYDEQLSIMLSDLNVPTKKVNSNLAILENGTIKQVYKGISDECGNSLYLTYNNHFQLYPNQITKLVERDVEIKMIRCARSILSFLSKSQYRTIVKKALKNDFVEKISTLKEIDLNTINISTDYFKQIAFQLGQTLALMKGLEIYTKEDIIKIYPDLEQYLKRNIKSLNNLQLFKNKFIYACMDEIPKMKTYIEYKA